MHRLLGCIALVVGFVVGACAVDDADAPRSDGPTVAVGAAALSTAEITGATYRVLIEFSEDGGSTWQTLYGPELLTSESGDGGAATFIGPCQSGPDGPLPNRVTMAMVDYTTGEPPDEEVVTDGLPPSRVVQFDCEENKDHRAAFEFRVISSAEQGFTDITVDLGTNHCAMKVDCQEDLETDLDGNRGFTMVTGFACSSGEPDAFLAFYGEVCCDDPNAAGGPASYCTDYDAVADVNVTSNPGVLKVKRHTGDEAVLDKMYHNTTWRFDEDWLLADSARSCTLRAEGWITPEASAPGEDTYPGEGYPKVVWEATVDATTIGPPHVTDCGQVAPTYGEIPCDPAGSPFGGGSGTPSDPWILCAPQHIQNMEGNLGDHFIMATHIDFAGWTGGDSGDFITLGWPAATGGDPDGARFTGTFNGNSKAIRNFQNTTSEYVVNDDAVAALFYEVVGATIRDVTFDAPALAGGATSDPADASYAAVLAANLYLSQVTRVTVQDATIVGGDGPICAGLVGRVGWPQALPVIPLSLRTTFSDVHVNLTVSGCGMVGGIIGEVRHNDSTLDGVTIVSSSVSGALNGNSDCGGLVGSTRAEATAILTDVTMSADVTCPDVVAGYSTKASPDLVATRVAILGDLTSTSPSLAAGFAAAQIGAMTLTDVTVISTITGDDAAALANDAGAPVALADSEITATLLGARGAYGAVGSVAGTMDVTDTTFDVVASATRVVAGIAGTVADVSTITRTTVTGDLTSDGDAAGFVNNAQGLAVDQSMMLADIAAGLGPGGAPGQLAAGMALNNRRGLSITDSAVFGSIGSSGEVAGLVHTDQSLPGAPGVVTRTWTAGAISASDLVAGFFLRVTYLDVTDAFTVASLSGGATIVAGLVGDITDAGTFTNVFAAPKIGVCGIDCDAVFGPDAVASAPTVVHGYVIEQALAGAGTTSTFAVVDAADADNPASFGGGVGGFDFTAVWDMGLPAGTPHGAQVMPILR